jgi:hypothetical protein
VVTQHHLVLALEDVVADHARRDRVEIQFLFDLARDRRLRGSR